MLPRYLGGHYPYYLEADPDRTSATLSGLLETLGPGEKVLDVAGVCEVLSVRHLLGDRTLVQGVRRWPWLGTRSNDRWHLLEPPSHGHERGSPDEIAEVLRRGLSADLRARLDGVDRVGLLLSGGMDSRVIASILYDLQKSGEYAGEVEVLTWGIPGCRDVAYAELVAQRLGWSFTHLHLDAGVLKANFSLAAELGAEVSPFHLHAMDQAVRLEGIDAFVAGSYGDMVGRAEFASRHVLRLRPMLPRRLNPFGLLRREVVAATRESVEGDAGSVRRRVKRDQEFQYRELEQHAHYTRRLLSGAMNAISSRARLYQAYTSPECYGNMWTYDPAVRDNRVYGALLRLLPGSLLDIPWARTGRPYGSAESSTDPDPRPKNFHRYGPWAREELRPFITELVLSSDLRETGLFNGAALERLLRAWSVGRTISLNHIDENIAWLATLALFLREYRIGEVSHVADRGTIDRVRSVTGPAQAWVIGAVRNRLRT